MGKRANGEGTISKRMREGRVIGWRTAVTVGYDEQGKQIRRWVSGRTREEVLQALKGMQRDQHDGTLHAKSGVTLGQYLGEWLDAKEHKGVRPNTLRSYRDSVRLYIEPHLGRTPMEKLAPRDVEQLQVKLRRSGKSPAAANYALRILKMALKHAMHLNLVPRNVAAGVRPLKREQHEMNVWTAEQTHAFVESSQGHRLHAAFYLAVMTGLRRGELLGLKWRDIDWESRRLNLRQQILEVRFPGKEGKMHAGRATISSTVIEQSPLKTQKSRRSVVLSPGTIIKLREHQTAQNHEWEGLEADRADQDFVFADELGRPTLPRTLYAIFRQLAVQAGVPRIRFHDLRHTAASLMIQQGLSPKVVSDRLGHTDVAFTMRVYTHLYDEQREEAAFDLSDILSKDKVR